MPQEEQTYIRYQHVLAWRQAGLSYREIGQRLGVSGQRASVLGDQARRWRTQREQTPLLPSAAVGFTAQTPVPALPLALPAQRALWHHGVRTLGEVAAHSDAELLRLPSIGAGTVARLRACVAASTTSVADARDV